MTKGEGMALSKEVTQPDGVVTAYHRVERVTIVPNVGNTIRVVSYIGREGREAARACDARACGGDFDVPRPYAAYTDLGCPYDGSMTVRSAYEALRSLDVFRDAQDVPADGGADQPTEEGE